MQEYVAACPHQGMEDCILIQNFYHGLVPLDRSHLDATAGGAFFLLNVTDAEALINKHFERRCLDILLVVTLRNANTQLHEVNPTDAAPEKGGRGWQHRPKCRTSFCASRCLKS